MYTLFFQYVFYLILYIITLRYKYCYYKAGLEKLL